MERAKNIFKNKKAWFDFCDNLNRLNHKTIAKLTIELVSIDKNCPVQIMANTRFQLSI